MSLLQDALRKVQQGPGGGTPPGSPSPSSYGPAPGSKKGWRVTSAVALVAAFLLGAGVIYFAARHRNEVSSQTQVFSVVSSIAESPPSSHASATSETPVLAGGTSTNPGVSPPAVRKGPAVFHSMSPPRSADAPEAGDTVERSKAGRVLRGAPASEVAVPRGISPSAEPVDPVSRSREVELLAAYNRAVTAQQSGDFEVSARLFREVVTGDPTLMEGWNGLGVSLTNLGRSAEAEEAFQKAIFLDPDYAMALVNAGLLRMQGGRVEEAARMFERASTVDPTEVTARVNLAIAQVRLGRLRDAKATLLAARRVFPADPDVVYHLGTVHERRGEVPAAAMTYSDFLSLSAGRDPEKERLVTERLRDFGR